MGLQYRIDRAAQRSGYHRRSTQFGLQHPRIDNLALVFIGLFFGVLVGLVWHSIALGVVVGLAAGLLVSLRVKANHRRRVANGSSAVYEHPRR